jgi:hypothetical protein
MASLDDLHVVFAMRRTPHQVTQALIMAHKGFTQLDNLGILEMDMDITEMAKRMASQANPYST